MYLPDYDSRICVAYVYERLHDALDSVDLDINDHFTQNDNNVMLYNKILKFKAELAHNFKVDTGVGVDIALKTGRLKNEGPFPAKPPKTIDLLLDIASLRKKSSPQ